jgi:bifunctional non-homologous end joining protein LigD
VADAKEQMKIGRRVVDITRPDKLLFPEDGISKRDLVTYYLQVAKWILPHLKDRPLTLERYPDGIAGHKIIQKSASDYYPAWIKTAEMRKHGGTVKHPVCNDAATLAYLANQASITPHIWLSKLDQPDTPDQMVFDLDPSTDDFAPVRSAALDLFAMLSEAKVPSFLKTSGSKGLHIVVPLKREADYGAVHGLAHRVAAELVRKAPKERTLEFMKAKRGGRVLIDVNRNAYAQTYAAAYAVRARPGAPVSWPAEWEELERKGLKPNSVTISTAPGLLEKRADPWARFRTSAIGWKQLTARLGE